MITFNNRREQKRKKKKNLKHKTKLHQLKAEFLKIQKLNNLKQRSHVRVHEVLPIATWHSNVAFSIFYLF